MGMEDSWSVVKDRVGPRQFWSCLKNRETTAICKVFIYLFIRWTILTQLLLHQR